MSSTDAKFTNNTKRVDAIGIVLIVISATAFASMAIFAHYANAAGANPLGLMIIRFTLAAFILAALLLTMRQALPAFNSKPFWVAFAMGAVGYAGQSMGYFTALNHARAGTVALLLYLYPAIVTVLAALFLHERLTLVKLGLLALSFIGMAFTIFSGGATSASDSNLGLTLALMNACIYSIYILVGARFLGAVDATANAFLVCLGAAISLWLISLVVPAQFPTTTGGWANAAAIAVAGSIVAMVTFFAGLKRLGAATASVVSTVEPVVTVLLAWLFLNEKMGAVQLLGGVIIVLAAALFALMPKDNKAPVETSGSA